MTCLDTTFLIDLLRGKENINAIKDELDRTELLLSVAAPSVTELWSGVCLMKGTATEKRRINDLLGSLVIHPLDEASAREAGEIEAELIASGKPIQTEDTMIAGIARLRGEKLVTRDKDYARITGLRILKY